MDIIDKAKELIGLDDEKEHLCGEDDVFVKPDEFDNLSDYDSLLVDSREGAPE